MKFAGALVLALALGVNAFTPSTPRIVARTTLKSTTAPALEKTLATVHLSYSTPHNSSLLYQNLICVTFIIIHLFHYLVLVRLPMRPVVLPWTPSPRLSPAILASLSALLRSEQCFGDSP